MFHLFALHSKGHPMNKYQQWCRERAAAYGHAALSCIDYRNPSPGSEEETIKSAADMARLAAHYANPVIDFEDSEQ